jgi:hypothetical protein
MTVVFYAIHPDNPLMTWKCTFAFLCAGLIVVPATAQSRAHKDPRQLADYDAELRLANGRVDVTGMTRRLQELGVTTYYWLIAHAATDWEDLKLFLPEAERAHIEVWAYLVPPSESAPRQGTTYPEPFRLDYQRWGEEIARLSLQYTNLTAWVIDDFYENHALFTPAYVSEMQRRAKRINPQLAFFPLMYYGELNRRFTEQYRTVIDGVVAAYPQGRDEIEHAWAILNDAALAQPGELNFPNYVKSEPGEFVMISQTARVLTGTHYKLRFRERDDFTGPTSGYHFKQVLLDDMVVWEQDVAGGTNDWQTVELDVKGQATSKKSVTVAFRILDKKGVGNFGVRWRIDDLQGEGLEFADNLDTPAAWYVAQRGAFEAGFGKANLSSRRSFHVPFIVMTAAQPIEFKLRHGEPASPDRIAQWLRVCLEAMRSGKCDGVVTYCLDKGASSPEFPLVRDLFREFK